MRWQLWTLCWFVAMLAVVLLEGSFHAAPEAFLLGLNRVTMQETLDYFVVLSVHTLWLARAVVQIACIMAVYLVSDTANRSWFASIPLYPAIRHPPPQCPGNAHRL
jgi:hypothetical protein